MKKNFQKIVIFLYFYLQPNTSLTFKNIRLDSSIWAALKFVKPDPFAKKINNPKTRFRPTRLYLLLRSIHAQLGFLLSWDSLLVYGCQTAGFPRKSGSARRTRLSSGRGLGRIGGRIRKDHARRIRLCSATKMSRLMFCISTCIELVHLNTMSLNFCIPIDY
jgi:hypothetical protein